MSVHMYICTYTLLKSCPWQSTVTCFSCAFHEKALQIEVRLIILGVYTLKNIAGLLSDFLSHSVLLSSLHPSFPPSLCQSVLLSFHFSILILPPFLFILCGRECNCIIHIILLTSFI